MIILGNTDKLNIFLLIVIEEYIFIEKMLWLMQHADIASLCFTTRASKKLCNQSNLRCLLKFYCYKGIQVHSRSLMLITIR